MQSPLRTEIGQLRQRNDWLGIHQRFAPVLELQERHPQVWADVEQLGDISLACAKLAETAPNDIPREEPRKSIFLKRQAAYRRDTEYIRQRCIELEPGNPSHWSTLAYFHYQNVIELTERGGRRDDNLQREIEAALACFERALVLGPRRIKDHYRKGWLLTRRVPDQVLYGRAPDGTTNRVQLATAKRREGIAALLEAVRLWEALSPTEPRQEAERRRCRQEYIRALYNTGHAYYDLIVNEWDEAVFGLRLHDGVSPTADLRYNPADLEHAQQAREYFIRCWLADRVQVTETSDPIQAGIPAAIGGIEDGPNKLYWLGKVAFVTYWILSCYGQRETAQAREEQDRAEQYLRLALECPWRQDHARRPKDFIAELLARLYISKGAPERAIEVIQTHRKGPYLEPYVAHTLGLAFVLACQYAQAQDVLRQAAGNRANRAVWTSWLLLGCLALAEGRWDEATTAFQRADAEARRRGKQTVDSILIGQAFASYKLDRRAEAVAYLHHAVQLNPYRWTAARRLQMWQAAVHAPM